MQAFRVAFNPRPVVQSLPLANGDCVWVIDDVLDHPERIVALAQQFGGDFVQAKGSAFPGQQLLMPDDFSAQLDDFFRLHLRTRLHMRRSVKMHARLSRVALEPQRLDARQRICHRDNAELDPAHSIAASVLYLFADPALGGTVFFEPAGPWEPTQRLVHDASALSPQAFEEKYDWPASYITDSNRHFRAIGRVPARFNRIIFYDGAIFHSSDIAHPHRLCEPGGLGRLTVNGFFTCKRRAT